MIDNRFEGKIYNDFDSILFNTKGSYLNNNLKAKIVNNGIIFNDASNFNTNRGIVENSNKIFNDCGGIIINHWVISDPVINIPCG